MGRPGNPLKGLVKIGRENSRVRRAVKPVQSLSVALFITFPSWLRRNRYVKGALKAVRAVFVILLGAYLVLLLLETIWRVRVPPPFNLNHLHLAVIAAGAIAVLTWPERAEGGGADRLSRRGIVLVLCAGLAGGLVVWHATRGAGWFSYFVSVVGGALVVLLSALIMAERPPRTRGGEGDSEGHQGELI